MFCLTLLLLTPFLLLMSSLCALADFDRPAPRAYHYCVHPERPNGPPVQLVGQAGPKR
jgi:hypothetical protein